MSTTFGTDLSHYDGPISLATAKLMKAQGIEFASHKIGEGTGGDDAYDGTALAALRDAGIEFLGGYHVVRTGDVTAQVDELIKLADRDEGWWREWPGWFWQVDLERWSYDNVSPSYGIAFGKLLRKRTGRMVFLYASRGQYGDKLTDWDGPLWNADYGTNPVGNFKDVYPGNNYRGWNPYSGQTPLFAQFGSNTTIAGLKTTDADAFRGTVDDLRKLIWEGNGMTTVDLSADAISKVAAAAAAAVNKADVVANPKQRPDSPLHDPKPTNPNPYTQRAFYEGDAWAQLYNALDRLDRLEAKQDAILAAIAKLGGGSVSGPVTVTGTLNLESAPAS